MSCVVASKQGWIIADTRLSGQGEIYLCDTKKVVRSGSHSLLAAVGNFQIMGMIETVVADTAYSDSTSLVKCLAEFFRGCPDEVDGEVIVVGNKSTIHVITSDGGVYEPFDEYHTNGSGRQAAYGYLKGLEKGLAGSRPLTMQDGGDAVRVSSHVDSGVNDRLFGLSLYGHCYA